MTPLNQESLHEVLYRTGSQRLSALQMTIYALFTYVAFRDTLIQSNLKTGGMLALRDTMHSCRGD